MANPQPHSEHLTILMMDLCNYTRISSRLSRQSLNELHNLFDELSIKIIECHYGVIIKKSGDAFLATFKSPTNALLCSIALQNKFQEYNRINQPNYLLSIKIALHSGEVIIRGGDIYGDAVNITSRIEQIAKAEDILFSGSLHAAMNKNEIPFAYLGRRKFKGVKFPVKIFRVMPRIRYKKSLFGQIANFIKNLVWVAAVIVLIYLIVRLGLRIF